MKLFCDLETFSSTPIKFGAARYAESKDCKILLWGYAIDDQPAKVWDVTAGPCPDDLRKAIETVQTDPNSRHIWHNGLGFDDYVVRAYMPELAMPLDRIEDTMLMAYQHALPGKLADLCSVFKLPTDKAKDRDGARLIRMFCVPRDDGPLNRLTRPEAWAKFINYCRLDIESMREIYKRLPRFNCTDHERQLMLLDAEINRRGMLMDTELANEAVVALERYQGETRERTGKLTCGELDSTTRGKALIQFIKERYHLDLPTLRKGEVENLLQQPDLPEELRELLTIRLGAAMASVKKFQSILDCTCKDGRLRGCLQFRGATRTGRFSGRLFQPQNLTRPSLSDEQIEQTIEAVKGGYLDLLTDNVTEHLSNCLRGEIIVPAGKTMAVADYSNIEGRVLAWLSGEKWKLDAFREYDAGTGLDLYKLSYANAFNVDPHSVTKAQRQMGKVLELAMGYQGGPGAFVTFANGYGINLEEMADAVLPVVPSDVLTEAEKSYEWAAEEPARLRGLSQKVFVAVDSIKRLWRRSNPNICDFWRRADEGCIKALQQPGVEFKISKVGVYVVRKGAWLLIRLPSGRHICYPAARLEQEGCTFSYMGVGQISRKWGRIKTYGGKVVENITQAVACDLLCDALINVNEAGFKPFLTVHDEILTEAPDDAYHDHTVLEYVMTKLPRWADSNLPLAAAGFNSTRYHK